MSTEPCPKDSRSTQQPPTARNKQVARRLNFQIDATNDLLSSNVDLKPLSWRNLKGNAEYCDFKLFQAQFFTPTRAVTTLPPAISSSQYFDLGSIDDGADQSIRDYRTLAESDSFIQGSDCEISDDVPDLACRASAATTDVVNSRTNPTELSQNLQSLTDVMVNLNLTKYVGNAQECHTETIKFKQSSSKSETVTSSYTGPRIKFRSPSNYDQCGASTHKSKNGSVAERATVSLNPADLAPISHMLKTCEVFHPLDMEPKEPHPTPVQSPVRSLMDGGDAVDVRGLANRLSKMKSESSMKHALRQYVDTHVPTMQGRMDQIIEATVQQIADVSLRDKKIPSGNISEITATSDWLEIQNGGRESDDGGEISCDVVAGTSANPEISSGNTTRESDSLINVDSDGIVELDIEYMTQHRIPSDLQTGTFGRHVAGVCCTRGSLVNSNYFSPEENRFASYTNRKGKRKISEVDGGHDPNLERPRRKGKKKVAFCLEDDEVIRFYNGSWD